VVAREDAVSDREAGVGRDDAVVGAGDGHARPAEPKKDSRQRAQDTTCRRAEEGKRRLEGAYPPLFS